MATYQIVTWRGIPASVEVSDATGSVTRLLSERFQMLIDAVAMQLGLHDEEAYVEAWDRSAPTERPGSAEEVATAVVAELEERFSHYAAQAFRL
jgi:hypothetical protein